MTARWRQAGLSGVTQGTEQVGPHTCMPRRLTCSSGLWQAGPTGQHQLAGSKQSPSKKDPSVLGGGGVDSSARPAPSENQPCASHREVYESPQVHPRHLEDLE